MTRTTRSRLAAVAVVLLSSLLLAAACARFFYQQALTGITTLAHSQVDQRADLQWLVYREQTPELQRRLQGLTRHPAITRGDVYSGVGDHLAGHPAGRAPDLDKLRGSASLNAEVLQGMGRDGNPAGTGFFTTLFNPGTSVHLNLPIITRLNPDSKDLTGQDFLQAVTRASGAGSDIVMGYVDLSIDPARLRGETLPTVVAFTLGWLVLAGLAAGALFAAGVAQQLQLRKTTRILDSLAHGERQVSIPEGGSGANGELNSALRRLVDSLGRYTQEIETGKHLLNRKVEERTSQLSRSHEELSRASEAMSQSRERLQRLTYYDHLTTLPNRQLFLEQLGLLLRLSRRANQHLALLHIDLAGFHQINEQQGFHVGDLLLREVARRLKECVRDSDTVATAEGSEHDISVSRLGGDEFTVVLNQLDKPESARVVAERILGRLQEPLIVGDRSVAVHVCIGIASFPQHGESAEDLLKAAAVALADAKQTPARPISLCRPELLAAQQDSDSDALWRDALEKGSLELRFTPVVDTVMGSVVALHSRLCCVDVSGTSDTPAAESCLLWDGQTRDRELLLKLTRWQLDRVGSELEQLSASAKQPPRVALPLHARQFSPDTLELTLHTLQRAGALPAQLELCLHETVLAEGRYSAVVDGLREAGVYLSVAHFGLGRASLRQLCDSQAVALHIAPELAPQYRERTDTGAVRALVSTGRSLNLELVAEGIASAADYHYLAPLGVRQMSGKLFGEHIEAREVRHLLAPWHFIEQIRKLGTEPSPSEQTGPRSL